MSQNTNKLRLRDRIAFRYLMVATIFLVIIQLLFGAYQMYTIYQQQRADLAGKVNSQVNFLSAVSPDPVLKSDFLTLETLMEQTSQDSDIVYSIVVDMQGQPLSRFVNPDDPIIAEALEDHSASDITALLDEVRQNSVVREVRSQIVRDNLLIGEVWLGFSVANVQERLLNSAITTLISSILVSLLLAGLTIPLFNWLIGRPLREVTSLAQALAAGDLEQRAEIKHKNEISQLKVAFNSMASQLQQMVAEADGANKMAMKNEVRARLIINTALDAVIEMDGDGFITGWNKQAESTFGWAKEQAVGQRLSHVIVPLQFREAHEKGLTRYMKTGEGPVLNKRIEIVALHRDGHEFPVELAISPLEFEGQVTFSAFVRDITERKQTEETLRNAKEVAEAAAQAKSDFLANTSHEIRTPLNAIIGLTGLLLDTRLNAEQLDFIETIRNSGDALLTIINDILDFSKIDAEKLELEEQSFHLRQCVEDALDVLAPKAADKGVEIAYLIDRQVPSVVIGDITRLRQILVNLLSNAVKFTHKGEVVVSVKSKLLDGGHHQLHLAVRDTGIGIPADRVDRLFASFSQVDTSTTRKYGGTGLGLAISKRLAEAMGGTMWVESEEGKGSTFHFTIKVEASAIQPELPYHKTQPELRNKTVLIVDDNETNRLILTHQVKSWGMSPHAVPSGSEALTLIDQNKSFDLAILDMQMPAMDGLTLATEIRQRGRQKNKHFAKSLPLVMLTSLCGRPADSRDVLFAAQLTKPLKPSHLYDVLMNIFSEREVAHLVRPNPVGEPQLDAKMAQNHPLHILLAEDNMINQKVALRMLARMGYRADVAANGLEVLDALHRQSYDVVLMDIQMPEMDGVTSTQHIRRQFKVEEQPRIVAMTANAIKGDRERYLAQGMDDYVSKPIRIEELVRALRETSSLAKKVHQPAAIEQTMIAATKINRNGNANRNRNRNRNGHRNGHHNGHRNGHGHRNGRNTPHVAQPFTSPEAPAIEVDAFLAMVGEENLDILPELMEIFFEETPENMATLQQAATQGNLATINQIAHTLKGQSSSIGALSFSKQCAELMQMARQNELNEAPIKMAQIEKEYRRIEVAWQSLQSRF